MEALPFYLKQTNVHIARLKREEKNQKYPEHSPQGTKLFVAKRDQLVSYSINQNAANPCL